MCIRDRYAILLMMVARHCDMIAGELLHVIVDAHIYDRHVDIVRELIERPQFPAPKVSLNPEAVSYTHLDVYKRQALRSRAHGALAVRQAR